MSLKGDCVYEKVTEIIHCAICLSADNLVMRALRKEGKCVGHVWLCAEHAKSLSGLNAEFEPIYKFDNRAIAA